MLESVTIHSTLRLRTLRTADVYNERMNLCGRERALGTRLCEHKPAISGKERERAVYPNF